MLKMSKACIAMMAIFAYSCIAIAQGTNTTLPDESTRVKQPNNPESWIAATLVTRSQSINPLANNGWAAVDYTQVANQIPACPTGKGLSNLTTGGWYAQDYKSVPYYTSHNRNCCTSPAVCGACIDGSQSWSTTTLPGATSNPYDYFMWLDNTGKIISSATSAQCQWINTGKNSPPKQVCPSYGTPVYTAGMATNMNNNHGNNQECGMQCSATDTIDKTQPFWWHYVASSQGAKGAFYLNTNVSCYKVIYTPSD